MAKPGASTRVVASEVPLGPRASSDNGVARGGAGATNLAALLVLEQSDRIGRHCLKKRGKGEFHLFGSCNYFSVERLCQCD